VEKKFNLLEDLVIWLGHILTDGDFDLVVTVERKATAALRALIEMARGPRLDWPWNGVISSEAVPYLPRKFWAEKRVLVFNEFVHTGVSTGRVLEELHAVGAPPGRIRTAAYGVHIDLETEPSDQHFPHYFRFRCLDNHSYPALLDRFVRMLRSQGGLLLDTEHVELPVVLHCSVKDFFGAFDLCGNCTKFNAYDAHWADCLTVTEPLLLNLDEVREKLPEGTYLSTASEEAICKLRVVPRGYGAFAVVPIWYPCVPVDSLLRWQERKEAPEVVRAALHSYEGMEEARARFAFSLTTLVAGLELLKSAVAALYSLGSGAVEIGFPPKGEIPPHVWHLHAVYPTISPSSLSAELGQTANCYNIQSRNRLADLRCQRYRQGPRFRIPTIGSSECQEIRQLFSRRLLQHRDAWIRWKRELANACGSAAVIDRSEHSVFSWNEMMSLAGSQGIDDWKKPTAMDLAIDDAVLVTSYTRQETLMRRGYSFAAEEVCRRIRNEIMSVGMY